MKDIPGYLVLVGAWRATARAPFQEMSAFWLFRTFSPIQKKFLLHFGRFWEEFATYLFLILDKVVYFGTMA